MITAINESKVTAIILRRERKAFEMLVFRIAGYPFYRLPGGGIYENEPPRAALYREVEEESGIPRDDLLYLRCVGELRYFKPLIHKKVTMHDYLLLYTGSTSGGFEHKVIGHDKDAGYIFQYEWINIGKLNHVDPELRQMINPYNLPELFMDPNDFGLERGTIRIRPHCEQWRRIYEFEEMQIRDHVSGKFSIHHVGSTSVENLKAKPIIDILIGYGNEKDVKALADELAQIGYTFHGEHGIPGRAYFTKGSDKETYFHIGAVTITHDGYGTDLKIRDELRTNIVLRRKYERYKCKHRKGSRQDYTNNKKDIMDEIIETK